MRRTRTLSVVTALTLVAATAGATAAWAAGAAPAGKPAAPGCELGAKNAPVSHVIYLQFDNVHFTRDNPNVPSDLEQMPHLLDFLQSQGTLDTNHHTPLIAHTGNDILTSLTGVYGDRHGQPIANSYRYYTPSGAANTGVSFAYWTDPVYDPSGATTDAAPTMVDKAGQIAPAPWVPYTRAGCDVGAVATANTVLENTGPDVPKVFGAGSPEAAETAAAAAAHDDLATTDFVGIGVHCAKASKICAAGNALKPDQSCPHEPGGYTGLPGAVRRQVHRPGHRPPRAPGDRRVRRDPDRRRPRPARVPRLRRHVRGGVAGLRGPDAGGRRAGDLRLHLRRPRPAPAGQRRLRAPARPATSPR